MATSSATPPKDPAAQALARKMHAKMTPAERASRLAKLHAWQNALSPAERRAISRRAALARRRRPRVPPVMAPHAADLDRIRSEQSSLGDQIRAGHPDQRGLLLGASDWLAEEALLHAAIDRATDEELAALARRLRGK